MRALEIERLYRSLYRQVAERSPDRREAMGDYMAADQDRAEILEASDLAAVLRRRIFELVDSGATTLGAIAAMAGLNPAPLYRWYDKGADLKLSSVSRLTQVLELRATYHPAPGSRWGENDWGHPTLVDRTPLALAAPPPPAASTKAASTKKPALKIARSPEGSTTKPTTKAARTKKGNAK